MYEDFNQEKAVEKPPKRKFWQNLLIMDSGDLKRILSLSSMMLSFLLIIIYVIAYILLMPLLAKILGNAPVLLANLVEAIVPAVIATGGIMLLWPLFRDKRVLPSAYLWLVLFAFVVLICVLFRLQDDSAARHSFMYFFCWDVIPSLVIGNFAAWRKYAAFMK